MVLGIEPTFSIYFFFYLQHDLREIPFAFTTYNYIHYRKLNLKRIKTKHKKKKSMMRKYYKIG